jgi:hypothetical protein
MLTKDLEDSMQRLFEFSHAQGPIKIRKISALNVVLGSYDVSHRHRLDNIKYLSIFMERLSLPDKFCWEDIDIKTMLPYLDFGYREIQHAP